MLFLTTYPVNWLSYFYFGQAIFTFATLGLLVPITKKWPRAIALFVYLISSAIILLYLLFYWIHLYWLPFIICLFLVAMTSVWPVIMWNVVCSAFDVRQFKKRIAMINVGGSIGAFLLMSVTPFLIAGLGSNSVPYEIVVFTIISAFLINQLYAHSSVQLPRAAQEKKTG